MKFKLTPVLCFVFIAALFASCNSGNSNNANVVISAEEQKRSFDDFTAKFKKIDLPLALPGAEANTTTELDKNDINIFFLNNSFQPAFGEKDVPDLAENPQTASYFPIGIFHTDAYTALLVMKKDESEYYYLSTFNTDGKFIDGLCVAFTEGTGAEKTERVAAFNDDYSIQIRQTDVIGGTPSATGTSAFFEISADGSIKPLKENNTKQPA